MRGINYCRKGRPQGLALLTDLRRRDQAISGEVENNPSAPKQVTSDRHGTLAEVALGNPDEEILRPDLAEDSSSAKGRTQFLRLPDDNRVVWDEC